MDDPASDDYDPDGNPARNINTDPSQVTVKVCSPDETNVNDPEEWVEIKIIKSLRGLYTGQEDGDTGLMDRLRNDDLNGSRVVEVRKICHYDTNIDDAAQAAFDADPTLTAYVVPGDQYTRDNTTKDDTQYVDHEIITYLKHSGNARDVNGQNRQTKLLNQYQIDDSDPRDGTVIGASGLNPPYRLDPYQNIININFGSLAVEFFDQAQ
jgi:hypothetical protein